jgi:RNAse (barnase) inhibitor barstar
MADNVPYKYKPSDSALTEKEISAAIEFQTTKNNVYEKKEEPKTKVLNPFSLLLLDPTLGPQTWIKKFKYNKKISDGKLDEVTDEERLLFESKVDKNQPLLKRIFSPKTYLQRDTEKEIDTVADVMTGAVTGVPLGVKAVGELLTTGIDYTFDTDFTTKLDEVTEEFLNFTGEPETLAGQITQFGTQFAVPFKVVDKLIRNIGKLKPFVGRTMGMRNSKLINKNRFIQSGANIAQRMGTGALALGATDFIASGKERLDPMFLEKTNEEGKSGRELAAARFANKIKFGAEGALIGAGFPLLGLAGMGAVKGIGYGVGVAYDVAGRVINPLVTAVTKAAALDPIILPSIAKGIRSNADVIFNQFGTRVALTGMGRVKQWTQQLPEYNEWRKFTVDNIDPIKSGLKKIDNALSMIRSAGKNTAEALFIKGSASRDIRASAKKIQDLLKSIEVKSYDLAKGFEKSYNSNKTSPSLMNSYLDEVLEVLEGKRKLSNLPETIRNTTKLLKDEIVKINKQYKKFIPDDDGFAHALNTGTKSYIKKSFSFLNNPGYAMPASDPIFVKAARFAEDVIKKDKNLIDEAVAAAGKGVSQSKAIKDYSGVMIKQILQMGKVDNRNPFETLRKVGERLNLDDFLQKGEELPNVINKLLGQERNLKQNVLFTTANMMTAVSNKQMYDSLARAMLKDGQVFTTAAAARAGKGTANVVQIGRIEGMSGLKSTLSDLYTDAETARILTTNRGPLDILAEIPGYATMLQFKAGVQWGKTVGSPATGSRNFITAADFALMRGLIGGRASVTNSVKMQMDDIYNSGKLTGSAEEKLLANIEEGIKYGALDENIVVTELRELLKATQKGKGINSFDGLIKKAGEARIVELMGKLYAGGDHVWKWYGYNWYKSFLSDYARKDMGRMKNWFTKVAGRELDMLNNDGSKKTLDEAIKEASAYYVRNTMPTYSKVPPLIKGVRNLPLGNFVAFPAETLRGTFNVMNISTKEILSGDPILREMGYRGLIGMFTTQGAKGLALMKTYGAITGLTQDIMKDYQANLAPGYQRNSQLLAITKAVKGKFKMVDLSTILPYDYVQRPWRALNNAIQKKEVTSQNSMNFILGLAFAEDGPFRELLDPFISTPIGLEAINDIRRGYTKNGKRIWGDLDTDEQKMNKSFDYMTKALEPGAITTLRQLYSSITGVPYKGRVYDQQDVLTGLFTGVKPYDVDVNRNIDFLINDYSKIRTKAFQSSQMYKLDQYGDSVTNEFIDIQRNVMAEQARIYRAFQTAKKFGVTRYNIKKEMKDRGLSRKDIRNILAGNFVPVNFSEPRFEDKIKELRKIEKERGSKRTINANSFYPKYELKSIIRKLKYQKLDEQFRFDKIQTDTPRFPQGLTSIAVPQTNNQTAKIVTPPLPPQPAPKAIQTSSAPVNQVTGLTTSETALLSPDEQAIRLRQRGRA